MSLNKLTIRQAARGLRAKQFSSVDITTACLDAIREKNRDMHAFLEIFEDDALDAARRADDMLAGDNTLPPLLGIPLAIKDNILIKGKHCTAGSRMLKQYIASYDATAITKLKRQGAVLLGKTNLDEFAMGSSTEHSAFGPTKNPHDVTRVPGGSSGGSAAAVAADMCLGALGSDTGGSIRQPASFCGTVGFKPTYGSVSRHGLIAMASSLDVIGPMTKTVNDARIMFSVIMGKDVLDSTSVDINYLVASERSEDDRPDQSSALHGLRIGLPREYFAQGLDKDVERAVRAAESALTRAGAELIDISLPHSSYALSTYYIIVSSEISANMARYDGVRYGYRTETAQTLTDAYMNSRAQGLGSEVKRRIMLGTYALSAGYYDAYYANAQRVRALISRDFEEAFGHVDVIMGPTTPTPAFLLNERTDNPLSMYLADIYTVAVNMAGLPALSLPIGYVKKKGSVLPIGLQLIGPKKEDARLLSVGRGVEAVISSPRHPEFAV